MLIRRKNIMKKKTNNFIKNNKVSICFIIFVIVFELLTYVITHYYKNYYIYTGIVTLLVLFSFLKYRKSHKLNYKNYIFLIMVFAVIVRTLYILKVDIPLMQHDVGVLGDNGTELTYGHIKYIYTLFKTGSLPLVNYYQFYHPPFWHLIGALWLKFNDLLNISIPTAIEGLQFVTCMISSFTMLVIYKIVDKIKISEKYKLIICTLMFSYPTYIYLAGSINNDPLLYLMEYLIILYSIKWYENNSWKNTILLALFTGLCVMTKFSGGILAIPIIYIFLKKLVEYIKSKEKVILLFIKYFLFGIISLPIGLWYQIRNTIMFGSNGVPPVPEVSVANYSLIDRFFSFSFKEFLTFSPSYADYNLPSYIAKSSILDEFGYSKSLITILLVVINLIFIILFIIYSVKYLFSKKKNFIISFLWVLLVTNVISFYIFNYLSPYTCSMNYRYIMTTCFSGFTILFYNLDYSKKTKLKSIIFNLAVLFSILSFYYIILLQLARVEGYLVF